MGRKKWKNLYASNVFRFVRFFFFFCFFLLRLRHGRHRIHFCVPHFTTTGISKLEICSVHIGEWFDLKNQFKRNSFFFLQI